MALTLPSRLARVRRAAFAARSRVTFLGRIVDVARGLVPAIGLFFVHRMVRLLWRRTSAGGVVGDFLCVHLPGRILLVANGVVHVIGAVCGDRFIVVEAAHAGFTLGVGTLVVVRRVGGVLRGCGPHLLCHGGLSFSRRVHH